MLQRCFWHLEQAARAILSPSTWYRRSLNLARPVCAPPEGWRRWVVLQATIALWHSIRGPPEASQKPERRHALFSYPIQSRRLILCGCWALNDLQPEKEQHNTTSRRCLGRTCVTAHLRQGENAAASAKRHLIVLNVEIWYARRSGGKIIHKVFLSYRASLKRTLNKDLTAVCVRMKGEAWREEYM